MRGGLYPSLVPGAIMFVVAGCGTPKNPTAATSGNATHSDSRNDGSNNNIADEASWLAVAAVSTVHQGSPVSDEEAKRVGNAIELAVEAGDVDVFCLQFDVAALAALIGSAFPEMTVDGVPFRTAMAERAQPLLEKFAQRIVMSLGEQGSYQFIRVCDRPDGKRLLFRMQQGDGAFTYHEICLARRGKEVRAVDIYNWMIGQRISEGFQQFIAGALSASTKQRAKGGPWNAEVTHNAQQVAEMANALNRGEPERAIEIYAALPESFQRLKPAMIVRVLALEQTDDPQYSTAIDEYRTAFPSDANLDFLSFHSYFSRGDYRSAEGAIDRVEREIGADSALQLWRARLSLAEEKIDDADRLVAEVLAANPRDLPAHWFLVDLSLQQREFKRTASILTKIRDDFRIELDDLTELPAYSEFIRSQEYADWLKSLK